MRYLWRFLKKSSIFFIVATGVVVIGVTYYIEFQLPDINALSTIQLQVPLQILSHDGKLIAEYGEKRRIPIPYNKIPHELIQAVLATEDQRYFQHPGIDIPGLARASLILLATGKKIQGGSTITMQVARSFYLNPKKTFGRKLREILLALKIDHKLSKQKILELYLNKIFLGNRAYGVGAAAQIYYGKTLDQLTLDQYAMLAGLPKAPSALNPIANPEAAKRRRDHVLSRMYEVGYIDQATYKKALDAPLNAHYHELQTQVKAPYAAELVRQQLEQMYGDNIYTDGYYVYTTIDSHLQDIANQAVRENLLAYDQRHGYRGPENNLGTPNLNHMQEWEKTLSAIPVLGNLEPAAVVDMTNKTVTALRANGNLVVIPWDGLAWARPQVNANYLGRKPHSAGDILKLGDLIRVVNINQSWRLAQIPKAEAGLVTLNPWDGAILALVGGFDFQHSNFNRITTAERQPGSSFKPFIYSAALDQGYTLATVINDAPIVVENPTDNSLWRPQNDTKRFYGPTRLREALIHSINLVSIRLLDQITIPYAVNYAQRFGFGPSQLPPTLSLALGTALVTPLQMATGYAVFANGGYKVVPFAIDNIRNSQGQVLYQAKPLTVCRNCTPTQMQQPETPQAPRVISAQNAFLINSALHDVIEHGSAIQARSLKRNDLSGKTGTTQNQVDAWFAGYNPDFVTLTWMGFDQPQSLHEYGNQAALPIWMEFMQMALKGRPDRPLEQPPGIVSVKIDPLTGKRSLANDPVAQFEYFMTPYVPDDDSKPAASPAELASTPAMAPAATTTEDGGLY
ncbi:MAG TPA: penicillin-binding protein 1A [Gammaproteobacteria bacterium]|nr:penicillin-binding protein 1A [Gammaproteobacteria bacterium]